MLRLTCARVSRPARTMQNGPAPQVGGAVQPVTAPRRWRGSIPARLLMVTAVSAFRQPSLRHARRL